jgi:hypothetical protein
MRKTKDKNSVIKALARTPILGRPIHEAVVFVKAVVDGPGLKHYGSIRKEYFGIRKEVDSGRKTIRQVYLNDGEVNRNLYRLDPSGNLSEIELLKIYAKATGNDEEFYSARQEANQICGRKFMKSLEVLFDPENEENILFRTVGMQEYSKLRSASPSETYEEKVALLNEIGTKAYVEQLRNKHLSQTSNNHNLIGLTTETIGDI